MRKAAAAELDEDRARALCLLRACEEGAPDAALWSPEDAAWAGRLADETVSSSATAAAWLAERARHARERLLLRREPLARAYAKRAWGPRWVMAAALLGGACGLLADIAGGTQHINLLHVPVWAVVAWNLVVYGWIAMHAWRGTGVAAAPAAPGPLQRMVQRWFTGVTVVAPTVGLPAADGEPRAPAGPRARREAPERRFVQLWAQVSAPLAAGRAAVLLHVAAAALALGLVAGLYARALVLDYRISWQSTLLEPAQVHALLAVLLAPASAITGIPVPDEPALAALRTMAGGAPAVSALPATAAPWLHLLAATLAWAVIVPRLALALQAAWTSARRAAHLPVAVDDAHSRRLLQMRRRDAAQAMSAGVQVLPHGFVPAPAATLALRALLIAAFGEAALLHIEPATAYGDEDRELARALPAAAWHIVWFELAATPEAQAQGRFVERLRAQAGGRLVVLVDESSYRKRMGAASPRLDERRELWRRLGEAASVGVASVDLLAAADHAPALAAARAALEAAMDATLAAVPVQATSNPSHLGRA